MRECRVSADKPYIEFDREQHRISGDSGCNRFFGNVQITGASVKISQLGSTKRACLSERKWSRERILRTLGKATRFSVETNELHLFAGESLVLTFVSKNSNSGLREWAGTPKHSRGHPLPQVG